LLHLNDRHSELLAAYGDLKAGPVHARQEELDPLAAAEAGYQPLRLLPLHIFLKEYKKAYNFIRHCVPENRLITFASVADLYSLNPELVPNDPKIKHFSVEKKFILIKKMQHDTFPSYRRRLRHPKRTSNTSKHEISTLFPFLCVTLGCLDLIQSELGSETQRFTGPAVFKFDS
jgi:hypothetical protein